MQTIKGLLTLAVVLTFSLAAWYVLALFVKRLLGSVASGGEWGGWGGSAPSPRWR